MLKFFKVIGSYILTILIFLQATIGAITGCFLMLCFGLMIIAGVCYAGFWLWNIIF
jgi:hypothetical protein